MTFTVGITRPSEQAKSWVSALKSAGINAVSIPLVEVFETDNWEQQIVASALLGRAADVAKRNVRTPRTWLIFSSSNSVRFVSPYLKKLDLSGFELAAIGDSTAEYLAQHLHRLAGRDEKKIWTPRQQTSLGFAEELLVNRLEPASTVYFGAENGLRIIPDALRKYGWRVEHIVTHKTTPISISAQERQQLNECDAVVFAAPSAVRSALSNRVMPKRVITIGSTTTAEVMAIATEMPGQGNSHVLANFRAYEETPANTDSQDIEVAPPGASARFHISAPPDTDSRVNGESSVTKSPKVHAAGHPWGDLTEAESPSIGSVIVALRVHGHIM